MHHQVFTTLFLLPHIGLQPISHIIVVQGRLHYESQVHLVQAQIYLPERLNTGVGVEVDSDGLSVFKVGVGLYLEVDIVQPRLHLNKSVATLVIPLNILPVIVGVSQQLVWSLIRLLPSHKILYI
jgi:hypothetical protein